MEIKPKVINEHEGYEQIGTEVIFEEGEETERDLLCAAIRTCRLHYDATLFPERIVLLRRYGPDAINQIIRDQAYGATELEDYIPPVEHSTESIRASDYL
jgi:hypothetical protein